MSPDLGGYMRSSHLFKATGKCPTVLSVDSKRAKVEVHFCKGACNNVTASLWKNC